MKNIAVIPARGGSKRIPKKNIKDFNGKPLIAYPITQALQSNLFEAVVVSTDDEEIAAIAKEYGAIVPFLRDKTLADDFTGTFAVVKDAYNKLKEEFNPDTVCCIYATAPLLTPSHLKYAFDKFQCSNATSLVSVCEFSFPIQRAFIEDKDGYISYREPEYAMTRSQDLQKCYQDCGLFYIYSRDLLEGKAIDKTISYQMPRHRVIDIDTPEDWDYARALYNAVNSLNLE